MVIEIKDYLKRHSFVYLVPFFFLSILNKIEFVQHPFFGLEYEDSYIYSDAARSINYNYDWSYKPLQVNSCIDGSLTACNATTTYSGHLIALPFIISLINKIAGYSIYNIFIFNFIISFLVIFVVDQIIKLIYPQQHWRSFLPLLFLVTTPFINLFNTSGLAETFSSFSLLLFVLFFFKTVTRKFFIQSSSFWCSLFFLAASILIKRENIVLIAITPLTAIFLFFRKELKQYGIRNILVYFLLSAVIIVAIGFLIDFRDIENQEGTAIASLTFAFSNTLMIFPVFLASYVNAEFWGLTGIALIISVFFLFKAPNLKLLITFSLFLLYVLLYSTHYRSYYQVKFGEVNVFDTLRYSSNYFPLVCICLSSINLKISNSYVKYFSVLMVVGYLFFTFIYSYQLRVNFSDEENLTRIEPAKKVLALINKNDIIITDIPLIFHLFGNDNQIIVDAYSTSAKRIQYYLSNKSISNVYILNNIDNQMNKERYPDYFKLLKFFKSIRIKTISNRYELLKISK